MGVDMHGWAASATEHLGQLAAECGIHCFVARDQYTSSFKPPRWVVLVYNALVARGPLEDHDVVVCTYLLRCMDRMDVVEALWVLRETIEGGEDYWKTLHDFLKAQLCQPNS